VSLFLPERHEPLVADVWDQERARAAIAAIAAASTRPPCGRSIPTTPTTSRRRR
jgi:hypothetical protein